MAKSYSDQVLVPISTPGLDELFARVQKGLANLKKFETAGINVASGGGLTSTAQIPTIQFGMQGNKLVGMTRLKSVSIDPLKLREQEIMEMARRGRAMRDPAMLQKAVEAQRELFSTDVEKSTTAARFQKIRQNLQKYEDALAKITTDSRKRAFDTVEKLAERNQTRLQKIRTGELTDEVRRQELMDRLSSRFETRVNTTRQRNAKEVRGQVLAQKSAYENMQMLLDRNAKAMERIETKAVKERMTAQENIEYYLERNAEAKKRARKERDKRMSQATMGIASAGIGLFGQAGFPLLNIAFASMSGMRYAGIAAAATAVGELYRGITQLQDAAKQSAVTIGFLNKRYKETLETQKGLRAFYGGMLNIGEQRRIEEQNKFLERGNTREFLAPWVLMGNITNEIKSAWMKPQYISNPREALITAGVNTIRDLANAPEELKAMRTELQKNLFSFKSSWEGGSDMYKRIQAAAVSVEVDQEYLNRRLIESIDRQIKALEDNSNSLEEWAKAIGLFVIRQGASAGGINPPFPLNFFF